MVLCKRYCEKGGKNEGFVLCAAGEEEIPKLFIGCEWTLSSFKKLFDGGSEERHSK